MGGVLVLAAIVVPTLLWGDLSNRYVQLAVIGTVWMGVIGFVDDYLKVVKKRPKGMIGRFKLAGQVGWGVVLGSTLVLGLAGEPLTITSVPFLKDTVINWGWFYVPLVILVVTGTSNAVNLSDGLDGLAIGLSRAGLRRLRGAGLPDRARGLRRLPEPAVHPPERRADHLLRLGGGGGHRLPVVQRPPRAHLHGRHRQPGPGRGPGHGGDPGQEGAAAGGDRRHVRGRGRRVMVQVTWFKRSGGKRLFRMAPLHHHFELGGWSETQVVVRFWIVGILMLLLGMTSIKLQ